MTVIITNPKDGDTVKGIVRVSVDAPGIKRVNFYIDGVLKGRDPSAPFHFDWYTTRYSDGSHEIKAVSSNGKEHDIININVKNHLTIDISIQLTGKPAVNGELVAAVEASTI